MYCRGFHGKRNDEETTEIISDPCKLAELDADDSVVVTQVRLVEDREYAIVSHKPVREKSSKNGSVVLATLTTSYARIALYKVRTPCGFSTR